jgi:hypothetical protein
MRTNLTEHTGGKPKPERKRSIGFPQITLQEAVDIVVVAGQNGPSHSVDAFAAYMGHQTANSGSFRYKLAALRDFGLISRGDRDRVTLSALAKDLVMLAPEHYGAKNLLLAAFENCRLFGTVYSDSAKNHPMDIQRIRTNVVMRHGVTSDQAERFVDIFVKSAAFAGVAESDGQSVRFLPRDAVFTGGQTGAGDDDDSAVEEMDVSAPVITGIGSMPPGPTTYAVTHANIPVPIALHQAWEIDDGEIEFVIRTPKALPPEIYALMAEMATTAAKMADLLTSPYSPLGRVKASQTRLFASGSDEDDEQH